MPAHSPSPGRASGLWREANSARIEPAPDRAFTKREMTKNIFGISAALAACFLLATLPGTAAQAPAAASPQPAEDSAFLAWWKGRNFTGNWFGARDALGARGLTFDGRWRGLYCGVVASENGSRGFFDQEIHFGLRWDLDKLLGAPALAGLSAFGETRWRDPASNDDPNEAVEANPIFNPSPYESGVGWRLLSFGLRYTTPEMFGAKNFLTLTGGWLRPYKDFLVQPLSVNFANAAIQLTKGMGGNIPFSSSFSTWGGIVEARPVKWSYTKAGLFMSYPEATFSDNHGLMFQGYAPDTSLNSLFAIGETGITPEIGPDHLPGKYAVGGFFYGDDTAPGNRCGFYAQADQTLYREPMTTATPEGLNMFSMVTIAPPYNNQFPFYAQAGLVYEGLVPGRGRDLTQLAAGIGQYANRPGKTSTAVIEGGYRIQVNGSTWFQPMVQYLVQPNGSPDVANAAILGFYAGINF